MAGSFGAVQEYVILLFEGTIGLRRDCCSKKLMDIRELILNCYCSGV